MGGLGVSGATEAASLFVRIGADTTGLDRGMGYAETRVQGLGSGLGGVIKQAVGLYGVQRAIDATVGAAIQWESEFAGVEKTVEGTAEELAGLESELRGMARTMPIARGELAGIAEQAGALGIATQDIREFTEVVAMIGETTDVSSDQAATALGQLSNVLGLTQQDYDNFGAALVDLGNKGASTERQILEIASRAGAGADLIGIAADATLGWSSAVANLGIEAEAGGSALQRFFLGAAQHVGAAGEELETMADIAGVEVAEFARLFNEDASAALTNFIAGLGELTQAEQLAVLEALGFNDVRIQRALLGLAGNVDNLTDSLEIGSEAWEDNTALVEEYGKRARTTASRIEILGNRIGDLGVRLGEAQGGPLDWLLTGVEASVTGWENAFNDLGERGATALTMPFANLDFLEMLNPNLGQRQTALPDLMSNEARAAVAAWKQADLGGEIVEDVEKIDDYFSSGEPLAAIPEEVREAMAKAREEAVAGTAATMDALLNLGNKDDYAAAWEDYLEGANEVFTDAERSAEIAGQFAGDAFNEGLHSGDSARVEETVTYMNDQLAAFELMNPGVLAIGREVPLNLQAGMEETFPEVNAYLQERHNETLATLTLDEAQELGVEGIYLWWRGMQSQEQSVADVAAAIANRAINNLDWSDIAYGYGYGVGASWADGLWASAQLARNASWQVAMAGGSALVAYSPPKEGPLSTIDDSGFNIGKTWADGLGMAGTYAAHEAAGLAGAAFGALSGNLGPEVAFGYGAGAPGGSGGDTYITEVNLYFDGEAPTDAPQIAELVTRAERMASAGVG